MLYPEHFNYQWFMIHSCIQKHIEMRYKSIWKKNLDKTTHTGSVTQRNDCNRHKYEHEYRKKKVPVWVVKFSFYLVSFCHIGHQKGWTIRYMGQVCGTSCSMNTLTAGWSHIQKYAVLQPDTVFFKWVVFRPFYLK